YRHPADRQRRRLRYDASTPQGAAFDARAGGGGGRPAVGDEPGRRDDGRSPDPRLTGRPDPRAPVSLKLLGMQRKSPAPARAPHQVRIIGGQWKRTKLAVVDKPGLRPTP